MLQSMGSQELDMTEPLNRTEQKGCLACPLVAITGMMGDWQGRPVMGIFSWTRC